MGHDCTRQTVPTSFTNGGYIKYVLSDQPDPHEMHLQLRFRTWEKEATVFYMSNHHNTQFCSIQITSDGLIFKCSFNTSSSGYNLLLTARGDVSDGRWHNVKVSRFVGAATMQLDFGEGLNLDDGREIYKFDQFIVDGHEGVYAGARRLLPENVVQCSFQNGCLDDIRLNGIRLPLPPASTFSDTQEVQAVMMGGLEKGCLSNDPCRNVSCPKLFTCFDIWRKQECGCAEGTEESTDGNTTKCVDKNECLENPCLNGGTCINLEPQQRFRCECLSDFWGNTCSELYQRGPSPPHIVKQPPTEASLFQVKQCGDENDKPFIIECEAKGNPAPVYKWTKNGKDFNWKADGNRITQKGHGTLVFNSPKFGDAGQYQCFATNKWGTASTNTVFMRRAVLKSFKDKEPASLTAEIGQPFQLTCSPPEGWPKPQVSWVLQNSEGVLKSINSPRITVDPDGTLWFSNITRSDIKSGYLYACAAYSEATYETKLGNKRFLNISNPTAEPSMKTHKPVIQHATKQNTMVIKGSTVRLWCIIGGTPLPVIKWTRNGRSVKEEGRIKYENYNKTLKIDNVDFDDKGIYECGWSFINSSGVQWNYSHSMEINIYAVPYFTVEPELQYPKKGDTVEIKCDADGSPPPNLTWVHNGRILPVEDAEPNSRRNVSRNLIVIKNVTKADTSNYGCNASNEYGYVYKDVFINVISPDDEEEEDSKVTDDDGTDIIVISLSVVLAVVIAFMVFGLFFIRKYYRKASVGENEMNTFLNGDPSADAKDKAYKMPYDKDRYEISKKSFSIDTDGVLGSGEFGRVCKGKITINSTETAVAIKTANPQKASKTILTGLLSEIKVLAYVGKHVNITELLGANTAEVKVGKVYIFLELCPMGSLEKHLRKLRPQMVLSNAEGAEGDTDAEQDESYGNTMEMSSVNVSPLDPSLSEDLYRWAKEICNGMDFLSTKHVVHADLATRNVLLNANKEAKICDFGLSRRMYNYASYVKSQQEPLPWKWMAPESLRIQEFNEKTDVWAFGVTLWEMYSLGDSPYQGMSWDVNFANMLERGFRLGEPQFNEKDMYSVMKQCWTINPDWRPKFADLNGSFANTDG